ncbi:MAG TPA: response regulator transcription factor [Clostridium sp.]
MKILLVEDDMTLAMGIEYSLKNENFEVVCAATLNDGRHKLKEDDINLILLDVTLPDGSGYDLCREIRETDTTPIIFLTACDEEVNIVLGLDMGADDYLTKPVRVRELIARINAVARRRGLEKEDHLKDKIVCKDLVIFPLKYEVYKGKEKIFLTSSEYKLLLLLVENRGNVLTRKQLLGKIWDIEGDFIEEKTLTVYIKRLREKLLEDKEEPYIETIRGIGYKWIEVRK